MSASTVVKARDKAISDAYDLCNQRYGLTRGMQALMRGLDCDNETKNKIVELAKNRKFQEMEDLIDKSI